MKKIINFLNIHCDAHHYPAKSKIKIQLVYREIKKDNLYYGVKWTKLHNLADKSNLAIV